MGPGTIQSISNPSCGLSVLACDELDKAYLVMFLRLRLCSSVEEENCMFGLVWRLGGVDHLNPL